MPNESRKPAYWGVVDFALRTKDLHEEMSGNRTRSRVKDLINPGAFRNYGSGRDAAMGDIKCDLTKVKKREITYGDINALPIKDK